jgi:hypothetical protein
LPGKHAVIGAGGVNKPSIGRPVDVSLAVASHLSRSILAAIDEPLIDGVLVAAEHEKVPSVYALWQLNRAREARGRSTL